ncbi:Nucleoside-diphosphate-sugar epimerase [Friedmanniella luteola]|uniref:Nucleoside-diphosphate-sugar epimerase n=1 Tax=Friedmanniella luteola TaxID=546871 RepID=A0A1H1XDU3_9ACTN|nr:NAD-dependent epimerase/dehydratase family protein [Friedmanniella luteola]SDT07434.1 Nucleoside-diphosphate-sugar epimerase [Friedmanniella luteola]
MRIAVIGGSGHIGSFLLPRLVRAGHEVLNLSRGGSRPYTDDPAWAEVRAVAVDRHAEDADGTFGARVAGLEADVVVDLICFTPASAVALVDALRGRTGHLLHCGSIWMHGPSSRIPLTEDDERHPVGEYGVGKDAIARLLQEETAAGGLPTTSLHPGHISGPGWAPITPLGNLDHGVWERLARGEEVLVPGTGSELLHHVHADDVAVAFQLALEQPAAAHGEVFHATAARAMTVRGLLEVAAGWFDREPVTRTVGWDEFRAATPTAFAEQSWDHLWRSQFASPAKAGRLLGFTPGEPDVAVREGVEWLRRHGDLQHLGAPPARDLV